MGNISQVRPDGSLAVQRQFVHQASAVKTSTFTTATVACGKGILRVDLNVTAASGTTPTLSVQYQTRRDSTDSWVNVGSAIAQNSVGTKRGVVAGCDRQVQAVCTIGGTTPSFTFSLTADEV